MFGMRISLEGKTALVTGGNVGIGAGIAKALAECGAQVVITYFSHKAEADDTVNALKELDCQAAGLRLDATDSAQAAAVTAEAAELMGGGLLTSW